MDPEKKVVTLLVWDLEADKIIEMEFDQEWLDAEEAEQKRMEELREEAYRRDRAVWEFVRDDD